jgi:cyclohexanecarboxylate-CoA ligase
MRTVLEARWDPDAALGLIAAERVSFMIGPPTFFLGLRAASSATPESVRSLRLLSCGGAGVTPSFVAETAEALDAKVKRTYGSTEAPTVTTAHAGDPKRRGRETDGRPTGEVELRLDPATGELLVRGPEVFAGYTDAAETAAGFARGGWFRTGDLATIDAEGWLTITGRMKDVIIRGGENIAAAEVEDALLAHPRVSAAAVVGLPDPEWGEAIAAMVAARPGELVTAEELRDFAHEHLGSLKTPAVVIVREVLPQTPTGKILHRMVREELLRLQEQ